MSKHFLRIITIITILAFVLCSGSSVSANDELDTTVGMQMERLKKELSNMDQEQIDIGINMYTDVSKHWAKDNIGKMTQLGLLVGGGKGTFNPDGDMSVAAFLKVVVLALGYRVTDVPSGAQWYKPYVELAIKEHIIEAGEFEDYTKAITREQAGKVLYVASCLFEPAIEHQGYYIIMRDRIKDNAQIGDQYKDSFIKAYIRGYFILGDSATCNPQGKFTRAQACTTIMRLLDDKERVKFEVQEDETYIDKFNNVVYPAVNVDNVKAINALMNSLHKSKGYVYEAHRYDISVAYAFYESEKEREEDAVLGNEVSVTLRNTIDIINVNWFVEIDIFDYSEYKRLHEPVIKDLFKYLFEDQYAEALKEIDAMSTAPKGTTREIKLNDRYLVLWGGGGSFSVKATCKGGLPHEEFFKLYPNGM